VLIGAEASGSDTEEREGRGYDITKGVALLWLCGCGGLLRFFPGANLGCDASAFCW
jgi:hypothetical protein